MNPSRETQFEPSRPVIVEEETPYPVIPTDYPPGSYGKRQVLRERAAARVQLWHPDDCESRSTAAARLAFLQQILISSNYKAAAERSEGFGHE